MSYKNVDLFFMLEISEKAFHHSIVIRISFGRKRLDHTIIEVCNTFKLTPKSKKNFLGSV